MEYQSATHNINFSTGVSYLQDQNRAPWFSSDPATIGDTLYSPPGLNQQYLGINDFGSSSTSSYASIALPAQTQNHFVDSQIILPIYDAYRSSTDNTSLSDQVYPEDTRDTSENTSSAGPDRTTQDNRRSTRGQKPYERPQTIRKKAVQDKAIDESKVLAPLSPVIGVRSVSLHKDGSLAVGLPHQMEAGSP